MGRYIQTGEATGKAQYLVDNCGANRVEKPSRFEEIPADKALICVVANPMFEGAAYCYSPEELIEFGQITDNRPKTWLLMEKSLVEELAT